MKEVHKNRAEAVNIFLYIILESNGKDKKCDKSTIDHVTSPNKIDHETFE